MTDLTTLAATIDEAFERRADINAKNSPPALRHAIEECIELLDSRPGARRREEERPVDREPVAQESGAAVFPHARQRGDRRRLHALLRQGAAEVCGTLAGR